MVNLSILPENIIRILQVHIKENMKRDYSLFMPEKPKPTEREQKLVDICFEILFTVTADYYYKGWFSDRTIEERAEWVARMLRNNGFDTEPCGCSWGVLI